LLHFSNWIVDKESPYLDTPDKLEYPNHTWAAQDVRKANVLYGAYYFSRGNEIIANIYKDKADEFYQYVYNSLKDEETRTYTRILAILMQNSGFKSFIEQSAAKPVKTHQAKVMIKSPTVNKLEFVKIFAKTFIHTSLIKELTWLSHRSSKVKQLFGRFL
jgi:hypothetical protein